MKVTKSKLMMGIGVVVTTICLSILSNNSSIIEQSKVTSYYETTLTPNDTLARHSIPANVVYALKTKDVQKAITSQVDELHEMAINISQEVQKDHQKKEEERKRQEELKRQEEKRKKEEEARKKALLEAKKKEEEARLAREKQMKQEALQSDINSKNTIKDPFYITHITKEQANKILEGTSLEGKGEYFVTLEEKYKVNAIFALSVGQLESQLGKSNLGKQNNFFGFRFSSGWATFPTQEEGVMYFGELMSGRLYKGKTLAQVGMTYCNLEWAHAISRLMDEFINKIY